MYDYIQGIISEKTPSYIVIEVNGIGFFVHISLNSYSQMKENEIQKIYIQQIIREDAHLLFGFNSKTEREIFRMLISVSGIGANTARVILSSMTAAEIQRAIVTENVNQIKSVKGIGIKTAQRLIIELKDKMIKLESFEDNQPLAISNQLKEEALSALIMLGFAKAASEKVIEKLISENPSIKVEDLVKKSLKML